jgi:hypothetical protein
MIASATTKVAPAYVGDWAAFRGGWYEIIACWSSGTEAPSPRSLRERLWELVALERLERTGRGVRFAPYRYRVAWEPPRVVETDHHHIAEVA